MLVKLIFLPVVNDFILLFIFWQKSTALDVNEESLKVSNQGSRHPDDDLVQSLKK